MSLFNSYEPRRAQLSYASRFPAYTNCRTQALVAASRPEVETLSNPLHQLLSPSDSGDNYPSGYSASISPNNSKSRNTFSGEQASPRERQTSVLSNGSRTTDARGSTPGRLSTEGSDTRGGTTSSDGKYHLEVVQHPECTAELAGAALLSRLPLSPPLIVQVTVEDSAGNINSLHGDMPFLTAHLLLYDEDGDIPVDLVEGPPSPGGTMQPQRMLYGTLVSSLHHFKDLQNQPGMFFIFPDVSVRRRGTFRLMVTMMRLTSPLGSVMVMPEGMQMGTLASVLTNPFQVVSQSEFSAPNATALTSSFHRQGARMY